MPEVLTPTDEADLAELVQLDAAERVLAGLPSDRPDLTDAAIRGMRNGLDPVTSRDLVLHGRDRLMRARARATKDARAAIKAAAQRARPSRIVDGLTVDRSGAVFGPSGAVLTPRKTCAGHLQIRARVGGEQRSLLVWHLVYRAFVAPELPEGVRVEYIDGNPEHCAVDNLRFAVD